MMKHTHTTTRTRCTTYSHLLSLFMFFFFNSDGPNLDRGTVFFQGRGIVLQASKVRAARTSRRPVHVSPKFYQTIYYCLSICYINLQLVIKMVLGNTGTTALCKTIIVF